MRRKMSIELIDSSICDRPCQMCEYNLFTYQLENDFGMANHIVRKHYCIIKHDKSQLMEKVRSKGYVDDVLIFDTEMLMTCFYCEKCIESALYLNYKEVFYNTNQLIIQTHIKKFMLISELETLPKDITNTLIIILALIIEDEDKTRNIATALKAC